MPDRPIKPPLPTRTLIAAKSLRSAQTDAEAALWYRLRAGRLLGLKFRRQHAIPPYVADFYCDAVKLAIELDGGQHTDRAEVQRDQMRRGVL